MTKRWIVTALGQDRPGIVAGVTKALFTAGCNLEDSAMTRLEGEFAVMLIFSAPSKVTRQALERAFAPLQRRLRLIVHLKALTKSETRARKRGRPYHISIYGADRRGIVYRVSEALSRAKINITDVHTHRSAARGTARGPSLYMLLLEVELPPKRSASALERALRRIAKRLGVEMSLRPAGADVL